MAAGIHRDTVELRAIDDADVSAYLARPDAHPHGCVVVVQEIFGVNAHIRAVCDRFAEAGWLAVAPAFFDRIERGVELDYDAAGVERGRALVDRLGMDAPMRDIDAARRMFGHGMRSGAVGFCWGGSVAFLAATRLGMAAVSYYGGRTLPWLHERPQAPVLMHFGERDPLIPAKAVDHIRHVVGHSAKASGMPFEAHLYPAGHGFNRFGHSDHEPASADLAWQRSLAFLHDHATR